MNFKFTIPGSYFNIFPFNPYKNKYIIFGKCLKDSAPKKPDYLADILKQSKH